MSVVYLCKAFYFMINLFNKLSIIVSYLNKINKKIKITDMGFVDYIQVHRSKINFRCIMIQGNIVHQTENVDPCG